MRSAPPYLLCALLATFAISPAQADGSSGSAHAACEAEPGADVPTPTRVSRDEPDEAQAGGFRRFLAGLFSIENEPVKKRAGKYRYIEKE